MQFGGSCDLDIECNTRQLPPALVRPICCDVECDLRE